MSPAEIPVVPQLSEAVVDITRYVIFGAIGIIGCWLLSGVKIDLSDILEALFFGEACEGSSSMLLLLSKSESGNAWMDASLLLVILLGVFLLMATIPGVQAMPCCPANTANPLTLQQCVVRLCSGFFGLIGAEIGAIIKYYSNSGTLISSILCVFCTGILSLLMGLIGWCISSTISWPEAITNVRNFLYSWIIEPISGCLRGALRWVQNKR